MGDEDQCASAAAGELVYHSAQSFLVVAVESLERFVKYEQRRLSDKCPCQKHQPLFG